MTRHAHRVSLAVLALLAAGTVAAEDLPGKKIFLDSHCNSCHTVSAQGIKAEESSDPADAAEKDEVKPPDLSGVGLTLKAEFLDKYLQKKETIEGRKHRKSFKGTDADRQALVAWLSSLQDKTAEPAAKGK